MSTKNSINQPNRGAALPPSPEGRGFRAVNMMKAFDEQELAANFLDLRKRHFPSLTSPGSDIYLDSAATSLKPTPVIDTIANFYRSEYGTVHRAIYRRAERATELYDLARIRAAEFINAESTSEVIFTRGATDSINIVADALVHAGWLKEGQAVMISEMEHHSNIVPWQMACERTGAHLITIPLVQDHIDLETLEDTFIDHDVAIVAITHCSNVLGTVNPISYISKIVHDHGALFFVDGAQSAPHMPIDVTTLGADFFAFSGHKMSGPTGIGILWGKEDILNKLPPPRGGGDMIDTVSFEKTSYAPCPLKFEPGTPPIAEAIGLGRAIEYMTNECGGVARLHQWEQTLVQSVRSGLLSLGDRVELIGKAFPDRGALQSFIVRGAHPLDIATMLNMKGIAIRSGHLCGQPLLKTHGLTSLLRVSVAYYNTQQDIDYFISSLHKILEIL